MSDLLELTGRAEATHFWFRGFRTYVAPVLHDIAAGRRDLRLIDCGCGTGYNLSLLRPYGRAFGFDLTREGATRAHASGSPVVRADMERIPFASGTFDVATSFDVVQSVPDDVTALTEITRVLKPGGRAVLNVTAFEWLRGDHAAVWRELRRYTPAEAVQLVARAGLRLERLSLLFGSLVPLMLAVRTWQNAMRRFRPPKGDTDLTVPPAPVNTALTWLVQGEAALARRVPMPVGSSLLIVARKD